MPSIITHSLVGLSAGKIAFERSFPARFWILSAICAAIPDADTIGFKLGIHYSDFLGHRGFFHSFSFAFLLSVIVVSVFFSKEKYLSKNWFIYLMFFFIITASHGILDALTSGGLGIALLSPFDNTRYFFPWTPIKVAPIGIRAFFSSWGVSVMLSEILCVWIPLAVTLSVSKIVRKYKINIERNTPAEY